MVDHRIIYFMNRVSLQYIGTELVVWQQDFHLPATEECQSTSLWKTNKVLHHVQVKQGVLVCDAVQ